ncbi:Fc.00g026240.m01.CDS01 [Cosmosporella sp. VM-42]
MAPITSVAVLGGTGALGKVLIPALLEAGFKVTSINRKTRAENRAALPSGVTIKTALYTNVASLTNALYGHDALVEAFNPAAAAHQAVIVQAAIAAGINHFITPDFSGNTFNDNIGEIFIFDVKKRAQQELENIVATSGDKLSWTSIVTGPWYDWTIETGLFWINRDKRVITRYGSGDQRHCISKVDLNGKALVEVLKNPEKYQNRPVYFASNTVTVNQLIALVRDLGLEEWAVVDAPLNGYKEEAIKRWYQDTENGVTNRLASKAYEMLSTVAILDEDNRYGSDFSDKVEPVWDEGEDGLRESLKKLLS